MDIFLDYFRSTLPDDLSSALHEQLESLKNGDFLRLLEEAPVEELLRQSSSPPESLRSYSTDELWNDWIFARISPLVAQQHGDGIEATPSYKQHVLFLAALACIYAFLQSSVTGPPLPFSSAKAIFPINISSDPATVTSVRQRLIQSLGVDGVAAYKLTPNVELICLAEAILTSPPIVKNVKAASWARLRLDFLHQRLLSEVAPSLQTSIYDRLEDLKEEIVGSDAAASPYRVPFLLERAAIHTHHGFDRLARQDLDQAAKDRHFEFALTGLLGKRTKWQEKDTSQLVVLARSGDEANGDESEASKADGLEQAIGTGTENGDSTVIQAGPQNLDLNDDTLLESISFSEKPKSSTDIKGQNALSPSLTSLDPSAQPILNPLDSIILLSLASSIKNTSPEDGLTREETLPYATRVLEGGSSNWQVYTQGLLVRSRIEGYKSRTIERGLLQLQALVDQVIAETTAQNSTTSEAPETAATTFLPKAKVSEAASVSERLQYVLQLCSPFRWELEAELASRWVSLGGLRSALEIYERLEMWAEAALCWAGTEREDKAKRIVRRQLYHATNGDDSSADPEDEKWEGQERQPPPAEAPRLYCILGDIDQDVSMYDKAWEVSNFRYARAQRSLGRHYFSQKNYLKAADAYMKSLKINQLNGTTWFALGCCQLEMELWTKAVASFSRTVQFDDSDAEAWSNLAIALLRIDPADFSTPSEKPKLADEEGDNTTIQDPHKYKTDALKALKRAARLKHDSYRIWDNVLTVAASTVPPSYTDIVTAQKSILQLRGATDGEKCIDAEILDHLVRHIITLDQENPESSGTYDPNKPGLARMVVQMVDKDIVPLITSSRRLWQIVARLVLWRKKPTTALEANEKAWRAVTSQPGWEYGTETQWEEVVDATVELVDAYESLGGVERTEGLGAGSGELVAKDWRFKGRSAIRGIMGRGKGSWEGTSGWERLKDALEGLKG
ncbi:TPR-like protein [Aulographum hederae CBS 113979]|uniref:TPR-like protein n=1 Tax=Aulographum hederae CBS 113979 TaxID=1176131 RepID=A0A6G1HG62_9PEZI|nr:TPR-like protein [Aulographum hederae CBS 113979]